jgi:hypothetical protein
MKINQFIEDEICDSAEIIYINVYKLGGVIFYARRAELNLLLNLSYKFNSKYVPAIVRLKRAYEKFYFSDYNKEYYLSI